MAFMKRHFVDRPQRCIPRECNISACIVRIICGLSFGDKTRFYAFSESYRSIFHMHQSDSVVVSAKKIGISGKTSFLSTPLVLRPVPLFTRCMGRRDLHDESICHWVDIYHDCE